MVQSRGLAEVVALKAGNEYTDTPNDRGVEQLVARRAHNPKVAGSSPVPATKKASEVDSGAFSFGRPRLAGMHCSSSLRKSWTFIELDTPNNIFRTP